MDKAQRILSRSFVADDLRDLCAALTSLTTRRVGVLTGPEIRVINRLRTRIEKLVTDMQNVGE